MNKYYIKFGISNNFNAGSKAMKDIMYLLESKGYNPVLSLPTRINKIFKIVDIPILLLTLIFRVRKRGIVLYFVPSNFQRIKILKLFKKLIGFKLICFINDVESMRMEKSKNYILNEMISISYADIILAPNDNSIKILKDKYGFNNIMLSIGVWDYLNEQTDSISNTSYEITYEEKSVAFAGNLNKAPFVNDLYSINLKFKIWGNEGDKIHNRNLDFMGSKSPDKLIEEITECAWGLVWDGNSLETCKGLLGTYLRFNNSHKCGLYLAAGIPIIVWKESGMASFTDKYKIGISVSSLQEASNVIRDMDKDTYTLYRKNARLIGVKISKGEFFLKALEKAETLKIK